MAIEQGSVALRSPEEIMKERVGRVDQFFYMMRKNNAVIGESLDHIMHRGNKKRSHSHDYFEKYPEDATIAVTLGLQTNSKFIPLERVERMVGIFSQHKLPQEAPREVVDPKMDSILTRLDEMIPKDPRMPRAIIFSDPQDIAAFAVIESLINGSPNKKGERVIELFQNNPSYKEAEKLIVNINQHLSGKQKLVLYPIRKNRGEKKN